MFEFPPWHGAGAAHMEPIVNLEEMPGKVVGNIKRRTPAEALALLVGRFHAMGLKLPYPKGVYRFKTFEEADQWETKHRIEAAVKNPPLPPGAKGDDDALIRAWRRLKKWWLGR